MNDINKTCGTSNLINQYGRRPRNWPRRILIDTDEVLYYFHSKTELHASGLESCNSNYIFEILELYVVPFSLFVLFMSVLKKSRNKLVLEQLLPWNHKSWACPRLNMLIGHEKSCFIHLFLFLWEDIKRRCDVEYPTCIKLQHKKWIYSNQLLYNLRLLMFYDLLGDVNHRIYLVNKDWNCIGGSFFIDYLFQTSFYWNTRFRAIPFLDVNIFVLRSI